MHRSTEEDYKETYFVFLFGLHTFLQILEDYTIFRNYINEIKILKRIHRLAKSVLG
jgi:hypothetical protein